MRRLAIVAGLCAAVAACGPMRGSAPPAPPEVAVRPEPPPPAAPAMRDPLGCVAHPAIDTWEDRMRHQRRHWAAVVHSVGRGARHLPRVRAIVEEAGLPAGLSLLPAIESGFRADARGRGGSVGLWQLQARTARRFGLVVRGDRDDRLDPEKATVAAVRYLRLLHRRYRDWPLALAAYNAGEGRVDRALRRRPGATFWELAAARELPPISRAYVPRFLALVRVVERSSAC